MRALIRRAARVGYRVTAALLARALADRLAAQLSTAAAIPSFEEFCTSPEWFGFTAASPVQRALMQAADGLQPELDAPALERHFGSRDFVNPCRPSVIIIECGVRAAKSLIAAAGLCHNTLGADCTVAGPEIVKAFVTAPRLVHTAATFGHVKGRMLRDGSRLTRFVDGEPNIASLKVRRPDGRVVDVAAVAAAYEGSNLRSTWVTSAVISEAAHFRDAATSPDEDAKLNLAKQLIALRGRMLPRGQIWVESSPTTDTDPFHKLVVEYLGRPRDGVLVFRADSFAMFPGLDRAGYDQLAATDPDKAAREYFAVPTSEDGTEFFPESAIRASVNRARAGDALHLEPGAFPHWGGADLGFTKNSSAVAFARCVGERVIVARYRERKPRGDESLKPTEVCADFAREALAYNCALVRGDSYNLEVAQEEFARHRGQHGETVRFESVRWLMEQKTEAFTAVRRMMLEGRLELPDDPVLLRQFAETKSRVLSGGRIQIVVPRIGWTHGDVLEAVVRACVQATPVTSSFASTMQRILGSGSLGGG